MLLEMKDGKHDGYAIWAGTDNAVWSLIWNKGMSTVKHLFLLALELTVECQKHEVFLYFFHLSGDRMIATGTDGGSRGDLDAGISLGYDLRQFIPLNKDAFELAGPVVEAWFRGWTRTNFSPPLEPIG